MNVPALEPIAALQAEAPRLKRAEAAGDDPRELTPQLYRSERSSFSVHFGTRVIYKTFRRLEEGPHPDLELGRFLTYRKHWPGMAPLVGHIELRRRRSEPTTVRGRNA